MHVFGGRMSLGNPMLFEEDIVFTKKESQDKVVTFI